MSTAEPQDVAVLLIDAQSGFLDLCDADAFVRQAERLLFLADMLELPVVTTCELPLASKGELPDRLRRALPTQALAFTKATFDCLGSDEIRAALQRLQRGTIVVAGGETDVCVLLSVLSLLDAGYRVHVPEDCLFTSTEDPRAALARMQQAGAVPTTVKTLAFELTNTVDRSAWPDAWHEKLADKPHLFPPPDDLGAN